MNIRATINKLQKALLQKGKEVREMNDDLISKSALLKKIKDKVYPEKFGERCNALDVIYAVLQVIEEQPIAFNTSKVLEEIGKRMFSAECYNKDFDGTQINNLLCYGDVAEIICDGEIEEKKE